jgi:hypothetical protein
MIQIKLILEKISLPGSVDTNRITKNISVIVDSKKALH